MDNFRLIITGAATSKMNGVVAGAKVLKLYAYVSLVDFVNAVANWIQKSH